MTKPIVDYNIAEINNVSSGQQPSASNKNNQIDIVNRIVNGVAPPKQIIEPISKEAGELSTGIWMVIGSDAFGSPFQTLHNVTSDFSIAPFFSRTLGQYPRNDGEKSEGVSKVFSVGGNNKVVYVLVSKLSVETSGTSPAQHKLLYVMDVTPNAIVNRVTGLLENRAFLSDDTILSVDGSESIIVACSKNRIFLLNSHENNPAGTNFAETTILPESAFGRIVDMTGIASDGSTYCWLLSNLIVPNQPFTLPVIRNLEPTSGVQIGDVFFIDVSDVSVENQTLPTVQLLDIAGNIDTCHVSMKLKFPDINPEFTETFNYIFTYKLIDGELVKQSHTFFPNTSRIMGFGGGL